MELLNKVKRALKDTARSLAKGAKDALSVITLKRRILSRFSLKDLRDFCRFYGISEPKDYEIDFLTGKKIKRKVTREDYISAIMFGASLAQIVSFARRRKIELWDLSNKIDRLLYKGLYDKESAESIDSDFDKLLNKIKSDFEPSIKDISLRDEEEFKNVLLSFIKLNFSHSVIKEHKTNYGKVDLVVNDKYALELKYADSRGTLDRGVSEVKRYLRTFDNVAVIILDVGVLSPDLLMEYKDYYESEGAKVVIVRGRGKRKKKQSKYFILKEIR